MAEARIAADLILPLKRAIERFKIFFALSLSKSERDFECHLKLRSATVNSCDDKLNKSDILAIAATRLLVKIDFDSIPFTHRQNQ